ncbi:hypothetical protein MATL_G00093040 [Megalops atlanticus]|uniref:SAM domain-containing protein n=1 Tax=Megalops atlanticus TaxID=7932 RepID=A0A9D3T708_MEGAT|nr:hypothetical protein MATL_G00093040 [Megalops atlanticus]
MATHSCPEPPVRVHAGKSGKVSIERVDLRGAPQKNDKQAEYLFEVLWSDCSLSTVSRTAQEVAEFLHKISQLFPDDGLDKFLPRPPCLDSALEAEARYANAPERYDEQVRYRCLAGLPPHLLKREQIRQFFSPAPGGQFPPTTGHGCSLQYRGAGSLARPVCGVASIQPVISAHCSLQPYPAAPVPPRGPARPAPAPPVPEAPPALPPPPPGRSPAPQPPATAATTTGGEQNGILDWLRKLRLHKYYPVFKQLTMEKFLALTEEDLNKYDLTQGAKKKLKTQLELQNREKSEKRYALTQFPASCSGGVARVTPSSHVGPVAPVHPGAGTELRVEVPDAAPPSFPRDSGSSSGYSSSPSSPPAPLCRDDAFDRARELHRPPPGLDPGEKVIRPTAQPRPPPAGSRVESRLAASAAVASAELPPAPDVAATPTRYVAPRPRGVVGGSADAGGDAGSNPARRRRAARLGVRGLRRRRARACPRYPPGSPATSRTRSRGPPCSPWGPCSTWGPCCRDPTTTRTTRRRRLTLATLYDGRPAGGRAAARPRGRARRGGRVPGAPGAAGSGHRAQECKQPPMDAAQQGTFRLKYAPPSDGQDSGD